MRVVVRTFGALALLTGVALASAASQAPAASGSSGRPGVSVSTPGDGFVAPVAHRYRPDGSGLRLGLHCRMTPALS